MTGLLIAAPSSGSGKTTVTLGLMRALRNRGIALTPGKAGPDYIDPAFHTAASGKACFNYDPWAMRPDLLRANAIAATASGDALIIEAMMGLFDGAIDGTGSPADLAALLELSVVLVIDCGRMSQSVAALVRGYAMHREDVRVCGVILNKVGSDRHEQMLRGALDVTGMPVLGVLRQNDALRLPERHLGLVQAGEHGELDVFIEQAAKQIEQGCDLDAILSLIQSGPARHISVDALPLKPLGGKIAIARDIAFAFCYEHLLSGWRHAGAELSFFSPLADEAPLDDADAVYLPGGYPELHAGRLANAAGFKSGMAAARDRGARIFGECGGYMVLGEGLVAADGKHYEMLGFLPLVTSFAERRRHLGYRRITPIDTSFFDGPLMAHEFHYATILSEGAADRLFDTADAAGTPLGLAGLRRGRVAGSFMHIIDRASAV
ncbi:cobyrinic acid a,c-diamide synthase [Pararhizobium polonicum]|uniref:Hydrogenobyrinate a,c-diamide synthase n=1 Tax=Pararhizobium polonicum TaxID=1612624 RepID=A0A1C7NXY3_9HYPH|nr:cobyrinate a,c-diamide synthase [Pararhizobium polonicum]OBZ93853.1 cobyrinic acid a,c-diamide synthase [Pararhizobium polonicum]